MCLVWICLHLNLINTIAIPLVLDEWLTSNRISLIHFLIAYHLYLFNPSRTYVSHRKLHLHTEKNAASPTIGDSEDWRLTSNNLQDRFATSRSRVLQSSATRYGIQSNKSIEVFAARFSLFEFVKRPIKRAAQKKNWVIQNWNRWPLSGEPMPIKFIINMPSQKKYVSVEEKTIYLRNNNKIVCKQLK